MIDFTPLTDASIKTPELLTPFSFVVIILEVPYASFKLDFNPN